MAKPTETKSAKAWRFDPDIEHLLYVNGAIGFFLKQAQLLLDQSEFPESVSAIKTLSRAFENELEANLLRAYDRADIK